ncbi:hypothetical protein [Hydrogenophaga crocea]|uniref:Uncharacterized protein n=1 Tax=Hydrogenophaga crocea TaxID=2716225 RepID=A0A6G8IF43_9BURK|nr:hypothetical protein [Hydrogenophaga crocea]QIM51600.1 hypothetical protein G9Q37_05330 [Hydrogenophaga crocea]
MTNTMEEVRKHWLKHLLRTRFNNERSDLIRAAGITKGRLSQLLADGFGDTSAKRLVESLGLPANYFDRPIPHEEGDSLSEEALQIARQFEKMDEAERKRFRWFMILARNGIDPTHIPPAPPLEQPVTKKAKK